MSRLSVVLILLAVVLMLGYLLLLWFQRTQIYHFDQSPADPAGLGIPGLKVVPFTSEDGFAARAWVVPPQGEAPVILYFSGNYTSTASSVGRLRPFTDLGYGLAVLEYRGSGGGAGQASEEALNTDARAMYDALDALTGQEVPVARRLVHGFSLGSDLAASLAARRQFAAVVLEAPFASGTDYFTTMFHGVPMNLLMWRERHDTGMQIGDIAAPLLLLRAGQDESVPQYSFDNLVALAPPQTEVRTYPKSGHAGMAQHGATADILGFYRRHVATAP